MLEKSLVELMRLGEPDQLTKTDPISLSTGSVNFADILGERISLCWERECKILAPGCAN